MSGDMDLFYSLIESDTCPTFSGVRCNEMMQYNVDPVFIDVGGTFVAELDLQASSPAINRGKRLTTEESFGFGPIPLDINGDHRIRTSRIDLGAFEYQPAIGSDCPLTVTNPVSAPETILNISERAETSIELSQEYTTPPGGGLFLDAPNINVFPSLEIESGAVLEIHSLGCR